MIHAGVFKQVEVRLESRDSFPGGPAGEGRGSWKLFLRGVKATGFGLGFKARVRFKVGEMVYWVGKVFFIP